MIVEDKKIEKTCTFYVSDFHLEMILVPYINKKIEKKENIIIKTERDLQDTIEILVSKINLNDENKKQILNLGWKRREEQDIKENSNLIIVGSEEYINETHKKIEKSNINNINIVDCYNFDDIKDKMEVIVNNHDKSLNVLGFNKF